MGNASDTINVVFLGENYSFPGEIAQYVIYCNEYEKISDRLMNKLLVTMKKSPMKEDDCAYTDMREKFEGYMQDEGKKFITMLSKEGIYDVTESDVIYSNKGYEYYLKVKRKMNEGSCEILADTMSSWLEEQDNIYTSAASNIRGSGYGLISNSFLAHATFSAMEYSTLKRQAKEADRQYQQSIGELNRRTFSREEQRYIQFYASEIYPKIAEAFNLFVTELMAIYILKLQEKGIFNSDVLSDYSLNKSAEILKNLKLVEDKKAVLIEAYKICPFNPDVYGAVMTYGYFDIDTMKDAKAFHQESVLMDVIEKKIKSNLDHIEKAKDYIEVLAYYKGKDERAVLLSFYEESISRIKKGYYELSSLCTDSVKLDKWISENIDSDIDKIVVYTEERVKVKVDSWVKRKLNDSEFPELSKMELLTIEDIRMKGSTVTTLEEAKAEYVDKIIAQIMEYIKEANIRKNAYEEAYGKYNSVLDQKCKVIDNKKAELKEQGIFAFSKKKEIKAELEALQKDLEEFMRTEPVKFKDDYYGMYDKKLL